MTTVFEELENEHNAQRTLMRIMLKTSGDSQGRRELFARFRDSLETHAAAEERVLYSPLLAEKEGRKCAAHSIEEHQEMRDMLGALEQAANDSSSWLHWAQKLVDKNLHHMREEEEEIFPLAAGLFATAKKRDLAGDYPLVHAEEAAS